LSWRITGGGGSAGRRAWSGVGSGSIGRGGCEVCGRGEVRGRIGFSGLVRAFAG